MLHICSVITGTEIGCAAASCSKIAESTALKAVRTEHLRQTNVAVMERILQSSAEQLRGRATKQDLVDRAKTIAANPSHAALHDLVSILARCQADSETKRTTGLGHIEKTFATDPVLMKDNAGLTLETREPSFTVLAKSLTGVTLTLTANNATTVEQIKRIVQAKLGKTELNLVFNGETLLETHRPIGAYGPFNSDSPPTFFVVLRLRGGMHHHSTGSRACTPQSLSSIHSLVHSCPEYGSSHLDLLCSLAQC